MKAASWKPLSAIPAAFSSKSNNRQRSPETINRNMKGPSSNQPGPLGTNQEPFCASFVSLYIPSTPNHLLFNLFHKKTAKAVRIFSLFLPQTSPRCSPVRFKGKADIRSSLHLPSHNILSYEYILTQYLSQCTSHCSHFVIQSYNYQSTTLMIKWPFKMRQKRPFSPFCAKICILVKNVYRLVQKDCPYMDIRYA